MILWIIGLSGCGKTTIGRKVYQSIKNNNPATVLIDGDEIRKIFNHDGNSDAYKLEGRRINSERIFQLCYWLDKQGIDVICCILSIFPDHRKRNKDVFSNYKEVYLNASFDTLRARRTLYDEALSGKIKNVVGIDIDFPPPSEPDLSFETDNKKITAQMIAEKILIEINRK